MAGTVDRALGSRGPGVLAAHRGPDRQPQPLVLDSVRAHRVLDLDDVVGARAVHGARVRHRRGGQVLPGRAADAGRLAAAAALHLRRRPLRRTQLDDRQCGAAAGADRAGADRDAARHLLHHVHDHRSGRRGRRRQLRLVDGQHQHLLPGGSQGVGARAQRRWREPRGAGGTAGRPGRDRRSRGRVAAGAAGALPPVHRRRRGAGRGQDGQHLLGAQRHRGVRRGLPGAPDLGDVVPLHRHVRLGHRLQLRLRSGPAEPVRPEPAAGRGRHLHRAPARVADPALRRQTRRRPRRRPGHLLELRRDGGGHPGGARGLGAGVAGALHHGFRGAVRAHRHRQRFDLQDDPGDLPRAGQGGDRGRRRAAARAAAGPAAGRRRERCWPTRSG